MQLFGQQGRRLYFTEDEHKAFLGAVPPQRRSSYLGRLVHRCVLAGVDQDLGRLCRRQTITCARSSNSVHGLRGLAAGLIVGFGTGEPTGVPLRKQFPSGASVAMVFRRTESVLDQRYQSAIQWGGVTLSADGMTIA